MKLVIGWSLEEECGLEGGWRLNVIQQNLILLLQQVVALDKHSTESEWVESRKGRTEVEIKRNTRCIYR